MASPPTPRVAIHNEALFRIKRRAALMTLLLPVGGTLVACLSAVWLPVGALELAVALGMFVWVTLGLEVGFHRLVAHKAFETYRWVRATLWVAALMAGQGGGTYWIAQHRRHHSHSDTPLDPHSPVATPLPVSATAGASQTGTCGCATVQPAADAHPAGTPRWQALRGLWHAHQGHTYRDPTTNVMLFAPDLLRDPLLKKLDSHHAAWVALGLLIPAAIGAAATQSWQGAWNCLLWGGPVRILVQHQLFFTNSSIAHAYGEQRFETHDNSRNHWLCAIWTFGSALQNTHHAFASSAYLSQRWYELDIAGGVIRVMAWLGLAWDVRQPTPEQIAAKLLPAHRHEAR